MAEEYSIEWIEHVVLLHSAVLGHLDCFHFLSYVNNAAVDDSYTGISLDTCFPFTWVYRLAWSCRTEF